MTFLRRLFRMRFLRLWLLRLRRLFLLFVFVPLSLLSDGNVGNCSLCCGWVEETEDGQFDIYQPGTSCVRMSSETCSEIKDGLEDSIESIEQQVNYMVIMLGGEIF